MEFLAACRQPRRLTLELSANRACGVDGRLHSGLCIPGAKVVTGEIDRRERTRQGRLEAAAARTREGQTALPPLDHDLLDDVAQLRVEVLQVRAKAPHDRRVIEASQP